jgi:hypothetical protein
VVRIILKEWRIIYINTSNPFYIVQKIAKEKKQWLFPKPTSGIELRGLQSSDDGDSRTK